MSHDIAKKAKQEQMIVAALLVVFVGVLVNSLRSSGILGKRPAVLPQAAPQPTALTVPAPNVSQKHPAAPAAHAVGKAVTPMPAGDPTYTADDLRDPLLSWIPQQAAGSYGTAAQAVQEPPTPAAPTPPTLEVQGLWLGGAGAKAMIRGKLYGVGDTVEGVKITRIGRDGVSGEFAGTPVRFGVTMRESSSRGLAQPGQWR